MLKSIHIDDTFFAGINELDQGQLSADVAASLSQVDRQIDQHAFGFINVLDRQDLVTKCQQTLEQISWADTLVVVGIGGSDLGARAIGQALAGDKGKQVIFQGDSTDPWQIKQLLATVDLSKTVFNIISKSGTTLETISEYLFFKQLYQKQSPDWQKHFIFTTSLNSGLLLEEAKKFNIMILEIPDDVGGRFSVFTPVGLFPALAMGVDIQELINGAKTIISEDLQLAKKIAVGQYQLFQKDIKAVVIIPYSIRLDEYARWFRQLWAESLGKDNLGILPIQARGPADQHSQLQFYAQGHSFASFLFIKLLKQAADYQLDQVDLPEFSYLEKTSFQQIINVECQATAQSLFNQGRSSMTLLLPDCDAFIFGQLLMVMEVAVVYLASLLGVNAFDQPGVEESKMLIKKMLSQK